MRGIQRSQAVEVCSELDWEPCCEAVEERDTVEGGGEDCCRHSRGAIG